MVRNEMVFQQQTALIRRRDSLNKKLMLIDICNKILKQFFCSH